MGTKIFLPRMTLYQPNSVGSQFTCSLLTEVSDIIYCNGFSRFDFKLIYSWKISRHYPTGKTARRFKPSHLKVRNFFYSISKAVIIKKFESSSKTIISIFASNIYFTFIVSVWKKLKVVRGFLRQKNLHSKGFQNLHCYPSFFLMISLSFWTTVGFCLFKPRLVWNRIFFQNGLSRNIFVGSKKDDDLNA